MRKRAVNLEGLVDRLRLRVVAMELGGLPAFLRTPGDERQETAEPRAAPAGLRPERVPGPAPRPRRYEEGGRLAAMVALIGR